MEILIWLVVVVFVLVAGFFWLQSVRKRNMEQISQSVSREAAQAAAAKLDEESRKSIYRDLAKGDVMAAVQKYRAKTGASVKECVIAVRSLDAYPQAGGPASIPELDAEPHQDSLDLPPAARDVAVAEVPKDGSDPDANAEDLPDSKEPAADLPVDDTGAGIEVPRTAGAGDMQSLPDDETWVVPTEWNEKFGSDRTPSSTHFKLAYEVDGEQHEFSSEKLPPNEYDQLFSMLRDGDTAGAAQILHEHTLLPVEDLERMIATSPMAGGEGTGNVADFRFEGQGPDGPVYFDAADLPESEREELFDAIARTDLEKMSSIIVKHTSLPADIVQNMLRSFVKREE